MLNCNLTYCSRLAVAVLALIAGPSFARAAERVTQDLLVQYDFSEKSGAEVHDTAGVQPPLNLQIAQPGVVQWRNGVLVVAASTTISSPQPATRLIKALKKSGELTVEVWLKPQSDRQTGPARIVSLSGNPSLRNFTLGQDGKKYEFRLRTSSTSTNGMPSVATPDLASPGELTHVVYKRTSQGESTIAVNGQPQVAQKVAGDLASWSDDFRLVLANEATGDRLWLGELHLVAIYGRALSDDEIARNFAAGAPPAVDYAALLPPAVTRTVDFVADVQPILRRSCFECHSAGNEEGSLNLGIRARTFEGGEHGPVLERGNSAQSRLIHLVAGLEKDSIMPPEKERLTREQIGILRAWIDQGANWPAGADVLDPRTERARSHWAFQPLQAVELPAVKDASWGRTPIDRFILARLKTADIAPQSPASARQLIRRVTFDVIGLPPTPEEVDEFTAAHKQDPQAALTALVDRLLQSPHYGERWGRHWLDVARYADSDGQESDRDRPTAYHYRDFVIRSFNEDRPFDQFVRWQLAGDEYEPQNSEAVAATGFLTAGPFAALPDRLMEDERLRNRYNELDDMVSTIGTGMLGLTLGCTRCHDHKYDAIPSRDYYRLLSALHSGERAEIPLEATQEKTLGWRDFGSEPRPSWLFRRGDYYDRNLPVQLGFVSVLTRDRSPDEYWRQAREAGTAKETTYQRRAMAEWITDVDGGAGALLARVIVNRLWQHHFGQGLVRTVGDFGVRSEPPTHPELLEWLARDLVQNGWRIKRLQRMILTSAVFQQSSETPSPLPVADPDNRLLWKMPLQRLEAEILRDSLLAVSGTLNTATYGPAVRPPIAGEAMLARNLKDPYPGDIKDGPAVRRRSIYLFHKRVVPYPLLQAFDKPDAQQSCGRRDNTTVAPQALALLNDPFVRTASLDFADRLLRESGDEPANWIERGYRLALGRAPRATELETALQFLDEQERDRAKRDAKVPADDIRRRSLADFCQALFGLNEMLYVD